MNFGENLKKIREEKGISQTELARKLNVSRSTVCSWEIGRTEPNFGSVDEICKILNVSRDELATGAVTEKQQERLTEDEAMFLTAYRKAQTAARMKAYVTLLSELKRSPSDED